VSARTLLILIVGVVGVLEDLTRRRISNWTSGGALVAGLVVHFALKGWTGVLHSLFGAAIGFGVFLIFYLLGGMGGGDIKLMAGFGALLGDGRIVPAALLTAISGGLMAAAYLAVRAVARRGGSGEKGIESIPYAPAITAGAWLALVLEM
jgi:prepilin peptidase CpaA